MMIVHKSVQIVYILRIKEDKNNDEWTMELSLMGISRSYSVK